MKQSTPYQHFKEECWADRGYRFVEWSGEDVIWQHVGLRSIHTIRIKPNGDVETVTMELEKVGDKGEVPSLGPCMFGLCVDASKTARSPDAPLIRV